MEVQRSLLEQSDPFVPPPSGIVLTVTGHRLEKIIQHRGISLITPNQDRERVAHRLRSYATLILKLYLDNNCTICTVNTGMALGWDIAVALACIDLH